MAVDNNIDRKLDNLIDKIEILVDVIEKGGRGNRPSSMYHVSSMTMNEPFLTDRKKLTQTQFDNIIDNFIEQLKGNLENINKEIKSVAKKIRQKDIERGKRQQQLAKGVDKKGNALTQQQKDTLLKEISDLEEEKKDLVNKKNELRKDKRKESKNIKKINSSTKERERIYKTEHEKEIQRIKDEYANNKSLQRRFGTEDKYVNYRVSKNNYIATTKNRNEASDLIARSGIGNTAFGRYGQTVIERQQRLSDIGNFANELKAGGAQKIGSAMFGRGKVGGVATKALGGFGKALGFTSKLLRSGLGGAIFFIIDIVKFVGEQMNNWKKNTAEMIEHQTKQEQLQFELSKQKYVIRNQMEIENVSAIGDKQLKMLDAQSSVMLEALRLSIGQYVKGIETSLGPMMKGINQSAYDAATYSIDAAADYQKLLLHQSQREQQYGRYEELRSLQQQGKLAGLEAERGVAEAQYITESRQAVLDRQQSREKNFWGQNIFRNDEGNLVQSDKNGNVLEDTATGNKNLWENKSYKTVTKTNDVGIGNISNQNALGAILQKGIGFQEGQHAKEQSWLHNANAVLKNAVDYTKTRIDAEYQLAQTQKDYAFQIADKQLDVQTQAAEAQIDAAAEVRKMYLKLAQTVEQYTINFEKLTNDLGKNYGYTNERQLRAFQQAMFQNAKEASRFGLTPDEWAKFQGTYVETTGRNKQFTGSDTRQMAALGSYLGDNGLAANYASEMEIFNAGVADSVDMLDEVLQDVNKIGLNGRKYTKTLVDNLKLAQKYQFKDGTKGLMRMAKWAENTRFNLSSLSGMLDKISEGGLEGVITQGAQFQVLGGHAAMNADPIAMMYERYADPEAFAKRMQDMTIGYGAVDKVTGETKFTGNEVMMLEQIAKVQGRSTEDVMNEVRARNKREKVVKQIGGDFSEEQKSFISNNATYNKETGQFEVNVMGKDGKFKPMAVNDLTQADLQNIMPEKHEEKMEKYMEKIITLEQETKGEEEREKLLSAEGTFTNTIDEVGKRVEEAMLTFNQNYQQYIDEIITGQREATEQFKNYIEIAKQGNELVDSKASEIQATASNINSALIDTARIIQEANAKIAAAGGISYTAPTMTPNGEEEKPGGFKGALNSVRKIFSLVNSQTNQIEIPNVGRTGTDWSSLPRYDDGIISNNNSPIISHANNVTKINDGLVQSDPRDVAIFAKEGGVIGNFLADLYNDIHSGNGNVSIPKDMNIHMDGKLELTSQNGQGIDIMTYLQNDPIMLRALSRLIAKHITEASNGGRGTLNIGIANV